ncbi:MAG: kelch repeat-containing protein [Planctomycetota bacterium]
MPRTLPTLLTAACLSPLLPAQSWNQVATASNPGQIRDAAMAFHSASGEAVLFGGWPALGATWEFDGSSWSNANPIGSPPGRREFAMVEDTQRGRLVMFGGQGSSGLLADTWEYNGSVWTNVTPATSPPARLGHTMAYDVQRGVTVLFGGTPNANLPPNFTDTWEWDGSSWTQVATANAPFEPVYASMCYDVVRGVCVLTGGTSLFGAPDQRTWEYDGVDWTDRTNVVGTAPTSIPGLGVQQAQMVYDQARGVCVHYGGRTPNGTFSTETWEYDGAAWTQVGSGTPSSRSRFAMAFDSSRGVAVLYGGISGNFQTWFTETFEYAAGVPADYQVFGGGCAGSQGVPSNSASQLPVLGQSLVVDIGNMPAPEVMALVFGLSTVTPAVDLGFLGAPGCPARVSPDVLVAVTGGAGTASYTLPIPNNPALMAAELHTQAVVLEAAANAFGAIVSNAATATLGT